MKNEKSGLSLAPVCAGVVMMALAPAFVFAQAGVTAVCPEDECHVAPFFRGSGGFVGQFNDEAMVDGEALTSVGLVVTCGNVTTTAQVEPAADGTVAYLFDDMNGLACHQDNGEIQIHGLMDGGWYWIHDEMNSAVSNLLPKNVLGNMQTPPFDVTGGDITMTEGTGGHATLVKDTSSGRVGILPHILPAAEPEICPDTPRGRCTLTGEYTVEIDNADGVSVVGETFQRGGQDVVLTVTIGDEGNIVRDPDEAVTARFHISGPADPGLIAKERELQVPVPPVYRTAVYVNRFDRKVRYPRAPTTAWIEMTVPMATDGSGAILTSVNDNADDPCRTGNQHRDEPTTVMISLATSTNTIPGFTAADGPTALYRISCPPAAAAARGVELVPDNPFPVD